eukprot:4630606-Amphidinium_carterae.2
MTLITGLVKQIELEAAIVKYFTMAAKLVVPKNQKRENLRAGEAEGAYSRNLLFCSLCETWGLPQSRRVML